MPKIKTKGKSWIRAPPAPASAAKTGELGSKRSIKVLLLGFGFV